MSTIQSAAVGCGVRPPIEAEPAAMTVAPAAAVAMRLSGIDAETLAEQLTALWEDAAGRYRPALRFDVSLVETCGRSGAEREHDAHRLVRAEANEAAACACGCAMRATLVRLERLEHLVLLACAPDVRARDALGRMAAELANRHATQTLPVD